MTNQQIIELLETYRGALFAAATSGEITDEEFASLRKQLITIPELKDKLPSFVKIYRTPREFFVYMQSMFDHYSERRNYITEQINPIIVLFEESSGDSISSLDDFSFENELGSGGYGVVYPYHHSVLDMDFAVKVFNPVFAETKEQEQGEKRFFREAKILFSLHHDNIVQIYNAGYIGGKAFIQMELIEGMNLEGLLEKYSLMSFENSVKIIRQILCGLGYAHSKGIIHRDLKPTNIMLSLSEKKFKIIDFGVSAYLDYDGHTKLTKPSETFSGSYIDPQLLVHPKLRDVRSDIYSVGAIWYYLLTGVAPSGYDMKEKLINSTGISDGKANMILKCLSADLENRYSSCEELLTLIESVHE